MASNSCSFFTHSKLTCKVFMPSIVVLNLMVTVKGVLAMVILPIPQMN